MAKASNLAGKQFGRLTAVEQTEHVRSGNRYRVAWRCVCQCGKGHTATSDTLLSGRVRSCGCLHVEKTTKHLACKLPEYNVWHNMLRRCHNEHTPQFKDYGGRDITVCDRWRFGEDGQHPFACFIADIGRRPSPNLSIDRIDNDGDYCPGNVRWATALEQARNKRTYKGGIQRAGKAFRVRIDNRFRRFKSFDEARAARVIATSRAG